MAREALPSRALPGGRVFPCGKERAGRQEAPGRSSPGCSDTSAAFLRRGGSGDGKRSRWDWGGNRSSAPVPRCRSLRKKQGWGPWRPWQALGLPVPGGRRWFLGWWCASFRLPALRSLPADGFLWAMTRFLPSFQVVSAPAPLPGPSGCARRAGSPLCGPGWDEGQGRVCLHGRSIST